jgi:hypothetical protein
MEVLRADLITDSVKSKLSLRNFVQHHQQVDVQVTTSENSSMEPYSLSYRGGVVVVVVVVSGDGMVRALLFRFDGYWQGDEMPVSIPWDTREDIKGYWWMELHLSIRSRPKITHLQQEMTLQV